MSPHRKQSERVDPDALLRKADQSLRETKAKQPHVNFLTAWLNGRSEQNGFGEDFDYTLSTPRRRHDPRHA